MKKEAKIAMLAALTTFSSQAAKVVEQEVTAVKEFVELENGKSCEIDRVKTSRFKGNIYDDITGLYGESVSKLSKRQLALLIADGLEKSNYEHKVAMYFEEGACDLLFYKK